MSQQYQKQKQKWIKQSREETLKEVEEVIDNWAEEIKSRDDSDRPSYDIFDSDFIILKKELGMEEK